jgi:transketolase
MSNRARTGERAAEIRRIATEVGARTGQAYIGQALGTADLLACVYELGMRTPRDRFVLSPGHYGLALYAASADRYDFDELCTYGMDGSPFEQSPLETVPGVEVTGGSLGQGLSQAAGMALGERLQGGDGRVFCLISDGELQEGQTWEALMAIGHHCLTNLVVLLDRNDMQVDGPTTAVLDVRPIAAKLEAFGLHVTEVDGHDLDAIEAALVAAIDPGIDRPHALVLNTRLGHGVPEFEAAAYPHYISAPAETWARALAHLRAGAAT